MDTQHIRDTYALRQEGGAWVAANKCHDDIEVRIVGSRRAAVILYARAFWGGFAYDAEARAFDRIFPPPGR